LTAPEDKKLSETRGFVKKVLEIALPAIVSNFFGFSMAVSNTVFAGHLGDSASMAGVGMAATYLNIAMISFMLGFNSAINTLLP
jgi:Na+-driven multidrug efflux pump